MNGIKMAGVAEKDYSGNIIRYIRGLGLISSDSENAKTYYKTFLPFIFVKCVSQQNTSEAPLLSSIFVVFSRS